jgi:hypothetical protein
LATATAPFKPEIAEKGDIIVKRDQGITVGAFGAGMNDRLGSRQPVNANVEETADTKTHEEDKNLYEIRNHAFSLRILLFLHVLKKKQSDIVKNRKCIIISG